jgi:hypothetical protein
MDDLERELLLVLSNMGINDPGRLRELLLLGMEVEGRQVEYEDYIKSSAWRERSRAAKARAGWRCQICNRPSDEVALHAHHRTYERLGKELPEDLTVLCVDCHDLYENWEWNGRKRRRDAQKELQRQIPADLEYIIKR